MALTAARQKKSLKSLPLKGFCTDEAWNPQRSHLGLGNLSSWNNSSPAARNPTRAKSRCCLLLLDICPWPRFSHKESKMIADEMEFEDVFSCDQISAASVFAGSTNSRLHNSYYHKHNWWFSFLFFFFFLLKVPRGEFLKGVCWRGAVQLVINVPVRGQFVTLCVCMAAPNRNGWDFCHLYPPPPPAPHHQTIIQN